MLRAAGRQIAKRHKKAQRPHGRQSVKKLMAHGENVNSIEVEAPKLFDRMARRFNVDYAFYKTGPDKYLLFSRRDRRMQLPPVLSGTPAGFWNSQNPAASPSGNSSKSGGTACKGTAQNTGTDKGGGS